MRKKGKMAVAIAAVAAVIIGVAIGGICRFNRKEEQLQQSIAGKILRFHILANSDSEEDQAVKLKVRDAVGNMMEEKLSGMSGLEETRRIVSENLDEIIALAGQTLAENGYDYGADARLARVDFPVKKYGSYTFPAGEYEALQITLGEGRGHNWWCVLYPNMCFQGSVYEEVDDGAGQQLQEVLTPEEYADVFRSGQVRIRFKFLEYFR
jgi:stage II sporulation protein R